MDIVSTHSRLKAAGGYLNRYKGVTGVSTHSRLKAAGSLSGKPSLHSLVSTHSRLKAAVLIIVSFMALRLFQHTAA